MISFYPSCIFILNKHLDYLFPKRIFKKPLEVKFWRKTLIIEAAFLLHNFCIDMRDAVVVGIRDCDPETCCPSYMEYLDPLGDDATLKSKYHAVHQAILQKIKSDGRRRPTYNIIRNHNSCYLTTNLA
jgi:hypothetical protein